MYVGLVRWEKVPQRPRNRLLPAQQNCVREIMRNLSSICIREKRKEKKKEKNTVAIKISLTVLRMLKDKDLLDFLSLSLSLSLSFCTSVHKPGTEYNSPAVREN